MSGPKAGSGPVPPPGPVPRPGVGSGAGSPSSYAEPEQKTETAVELRHTRILGDMDFYIEELQNINDRLEQINGRIFGSEPADISSGKDSVEPGPAFLSQRDSKHERIVDLFKTIQNRICQLEQF